MASQNDKLVKMLTLWLKKNGISGDTHIYEIDKWRERGEEFLNDADLVITTEGTLFTILNFGDTEEFDDLLASFGYYYEFGHSWSLGLYYSPDCSEMVKGNSSYSEKLKDARWIRKRNLILEKAEFKCQDCGAQNKLEVHHCYYLYGFEPWGFPFDSLRCLCKNCHKRRGNVEMELRGNLASLNTDELTAIIEVIKTGVYWYRRESVFKLLESIGHDRTKLGTAIIELIESRL